jgi:signal peptidase I
MEDYRMRVTTPNHPAAGKAGIARLLAIEHHCPGLPELGRWMRTLLVISMVAICATTACGRKSPVGSSSMSPTITNGERVTVDYSAYLLSKPKRWEVAVVDGPTPILKSNPAAKRVIALPLETISFDSNRHSCE